MTKLDRFTTDEKITIKSYNQLGKQWATAHSTGGYWAKQFEAFNKYLPQGKILEIGAGSGRDAQDLARIYNYTGVDVSDTLLTVARKNNPNLIFLNRSLYNLGFSENSFDGFWTAATLLHIPKTRIEEVLRNIHKIIRPNGIGFISLKQGEGEDITNGDEDFGNDFKRLFVLYNTEEFSNHLRETGFDILETQTQQRSSKTTWLSFFVKIIK